MADSAPTGRAKWFWIIIILLLLVVLVVWLWKPSGDTSGIVPAPVPTGQSTDWAVEPDGPSVPVTLPTAQ
ncbi:hypothetical protein [Novosphingobium naphthalenivorans]|uniref:hypothetical protein n=1 Tax=Novosphingobium naphthalenivorans TaxID=273168 RepID=UPI00082E5F89|nr:hypothetical protein [Novosphingobium naphthalenivorans]